jgi:outer membrane murein-binding lipoprotein Lpp
MRNKTILMFAACMALTCVAGVNGQAPTQYPIVDKLAAKVIQKYQSSNCEQLREKKQQPPSEQQAAMEQKAVAMLRSDPAMRQHFLNKVAAPIANKMFECGMIP